MIAFLAFAIPFSLYICLPSCFWNFDGVACATALELGQSSYFFHANHLIYGFLGFLFWKIIALPLGILRALPALQLFTSILSALGLIGLYKILLAVIRDSRSALLLTCSLAFTAAFWVWSIEAQVYTLGFLALAWAAFVLLENKHPNKYVLVGLLHGGAALGHLMHVLWMIPAGYWLMEESKAQKRSLHKSLRDYAVSFGLITVVPYVLVIGGVIAPGRQIERVLIWLKGSAGLNPDRQWSWHSAGIIGPWVWLKSTVLIFWGSFWPYGGTRVTSIAWIFTAVSVVLFTSLLIRGWLRSSEKLSRFCWLWLGVYGLFLMTWEPQTLCYRITDILPIGILLALGIRTFKPRTQYVLASLLAVSTLAVNLQTLVRPMHHADQNRAYVETMTLAESTPPNALYITGGGTPWIYLLYFFGRTAWNARSFPPPILIKELSAQKASRPVFIQSLLLRDPVLAEPLSTLNLKQRSKGASWLQVQ